MSTIEETQDIVNQYKNVLKNVDKLIKDTGLRTEFLAKKMQMPLSTFYMRKKKLTFTVFEIEKLVKLAAKVKD